MPCCKHQHDTAAPYHCMLQGVASLAWETPAGIRRAAQQDASLRTSPARYWCTCWAPMQQPELQPPCCLLPSWPTSSSPSQPWARCRHPPHQGQLPPPTAAPLARQPGPAAPQLHGAVAWLPHAGRWLQRLRRPGGSACGRPPGSAAAACPVGPVGVDGTATADVEL